MKFSKNEYNKKYHRREISKIFLGAIIVAPILLLVLSHIFNP